MMNFSDLENAIEGSNYEACREAFKEQYPLALQDIYEDCDDGEFNCKNCPWKKPHQTQTRIFT
jgi:hypothetical protein